VGQAAIAAVNDPTPDNMLLAGTLAKRIDAVGFKTPTTLDIFEVKPENAHAAVGQLIAYERLFRLTFTGLTLSKLVLVTERFDVDLMPLAEAMGVRVIIV